VAVVSSADRVVYPETGTTKGEVVEHFRAVAERLLKHIADRPLTLQRFPKGVAATGFMQKNASDHFPDYVRRFSVPRRDGTTTHPVVDDAAGVEYLANQNTITFHVPATTTADPAHPDRLIIDLDPPQDGLGIVRAAARATKELLEELGLASVPVATGSKGYHITTMIERTLPMDQAGEFGQLAAALLSHRHPDLLTTEFRKANRQGRVFCDWLRNRWGSTAAAPWSLRARPRPTVVVPIDWDEFDSFAPDHFELGELPDADPLCTLAAKPAEPMAALETLRALVLDAGVTLEPFDRFRS
jgi:bifunctional non-homologous end joining protein LigD